MEKLPSLPDSIVSIITSRDWPLRILELGPYDGRHTLDLVRIARELVLIESRMENARLTMATIAGTFSTASLTIVVDDLETCDLSQFGRFNTVLASGVIYHMSKPWELICKIAGTTDHCVGWSHVSGVDEGERGGYRGKPVGEDTTHPLAGTTSESWWMMTDDFERAFCDAGFTSFRWIEHPTPHENGGLAGWFEANK